MADLALGAAPAGVGGRDRDRRACSSSRSRAGLCRYAERLVGHDAAFRVLSDLRVNVYKRLERLAPLGLPAFRSGDLLARLIHDVDFLQDLLLRVVPPFAIALLVGAATVGAGRGGCCPAAGLILLVALLHRRDARAVAGRERSPRAAEARRRRRARELTASVVDLIEGAPELAVNGATPGQLPRAVGADAAAHAASPARAPARPASARG